MTKHKIAKVIWEDSWSNSSSYFRLGEVEKWPPLVLESVGFLIQNDKKGVSLVEQHCPKDQDYRYAHFIPRAMVRKVITLKDR